MRAHRSPIAKFGTPSLLVCCSNSSCFALPIEHACRDPGASQQAGSRISCTPLGLPIFRAFCRRPTGAKPVVWLSGTPVVVGQAPAPPSDFSRMSGIGTSPYDRTWREGAKTLSDARDRVSEPRHSGDRMRRSKTGVGHGLRSPDTPSTLERRPDVGSTTVAFRAARWSGRPSKSCLAAFARAGSTSSSSTRSTV